MRFDFDVAGDVQVSREILRVGEHASDARPAFRHMADVIAHSEQRQFDTQGQAGSGGWAPLKAETIAAKARKGHDPRILRATEALRNSLVGGRSGTDARRLFFPDQLIYGTDVPYARFHQHGTSRMPQRRPVELTRATRVLLLKVLQRWVITGEVSK